MFLKADPYLKLDGPELHRPLLAGVLHNIQGLAGGLPYLLIVVPEKINEVEDNLGTSKAESSGSNSLTRQEGWESNGEGEGRGRESRCRTDVFVRSSSFVGPNMRSLWNV